MSKLIKIFVFIIFIVFDNGVENFNIIRFGDNIIHIHNNM